MYLMASEAERIFSECSSGISIVNSSSRTITISTASRLFRPRSLKKWESFFSC